MSSLSRYRKAIAAILTGLLGWATAVVQSDPEQITSAEWIGAATVIVATIAVYLVPNDAPAGVVADPNVSERG
ncbi:MAG TPA: hypothetical protein VHK88_20210 [Aquihabitans sp.]|jgi:hypothetical protein|nr:hypothetical protein [Aquihabitans sp.]